jgi:hypothetical protein
MNQINVQLEMDLLNDPDRLSWMSYLLTKHQFSEDFLIKTIILIKLF